MSLSDGMAWEEEYINKSRRERVDTVVAEAELDLFRDMTIALRDDALSQGEMTWAVNLSHMVKFFSDLKDARSDR